MAIITSITAVWTAVMGWITTSLDSVVEIFYNSTASSLTFLGVLAVLALGISVFFLLMRVIENFLHLRG